MDTTGRNTLKKAERLYMKRDIEELFSGKKDSFSVFPMRVVFMKTAKTENNETEPVRILTSVSKRKFKRAVKRNRVKRQIREAYRKNKHELTEYVSDKDFNIAIAFIWLASELKESNYIENKMIEILNILKERLC